MEKIQHASRLSPLGDNTYGWVLQALDPLEQLFVWMEVAVSGNCELPMTEH